MPELHVTHHAVQRYQERVANVPEPLARQALSSRAVQCAAEFGAPYVRLPTGQRILINEYSVVTVLPKGTWLHSLDRRRTS